MTANGLNSGHPESSLTEARAAAVLFQTDTCEPHEPIPR